MFFKSKEASKFQRCFKQSSQFSFFFSIFWSLLSGEVSRVFQESFMGVSIKFQGCFKEVSRVFQGSLKCVSRKFQEVFKGVLRKF